MTELAQRLSEAKECDPEEISTLSSRFETELNDFTLRVRTKKEILEMAKDFYKCTDQVSPLFQLYLSVFIIVS